MIVLASGHRHLPILSGGKANLWVENIKLNHVGIINSRADGLTQQD